MTPFNVCPSHVIKLSVSFNIHVCSSCHVCLVRWMQYYSEIFSTFILNSFYAPRYSAVFFCAQIYTLSYPINILQQLLKTWNWSSESFSRFLNIFAQDHERGTYRGKLTVRKVFFAAVMEPQENLKYIWHSITPATEINLHLIHLSFSQIMSWCVMTDKSKTFKSMM